MTKKDYIAIAGAIRKSAEQVAEHEMEYPLCEVVNRLCDVLRWHNPRFNAAKFREACYGDWNGGK